MPPLRARLLELLRLPFSDEFIVLPITEVAQARISRRRMFSKRIVAESIVGFHVRRFPRFTARSCTGQRNKLSDWIRSRQVYQVGIGLDCERVRRCRARGWFHECVRLREPGRIRAGRGRANETLTLAFNSVLAIEPPNCSPTLDAPVPCHLCSSSGLNGSRASPRFSLSRKIIPEKSVAR